MPRLAHSPRRPAAIVLIGGSALLTAGMTALAASERDPTQAASPAAARSAPHGGEARVQLLGVNDLHGHLQSPGTGERDGRRVGWGGAAVLATHLDRAQRAFRGATIRAHAGDMVGASPLISSWFHDEPSMRAMDLMRFDVGTVGNHEFDEGTVEMLRLIRGGHRRDGHQLRRVGDDRRVDTSARDYPGAGFPYLAANTRDRAGRALLPPYRIVERDGVRIGFIGVTTHSTPTFLLDGIARRLRFSDISDTVNRHAAELQRRGVGAIVVLAHSGALQAEGSATATGEIVDETRQMSPAVDVVMAGHTHSPLDTRVPNANGRGDKLLMEADAYGTAFDRVTMRVDRATGEVTAKSGELVRTWRDEVRPDRALARLVARYATRVAPVGKRVLGRAVRPLRREGPDHARPLPGRGALGPIVAAAQREQAAADIGVVNPGNMRTDLPAGPITFADLFATQAYEHRVMRIELSGRAVKALLEEQYGPGADAPLHVSGLTWRRDASAPDGDQVSRLRLAGGRGVRPEATYAVAANELIASGGRFRALYRRGRNVRAMGTDLDALAAHVERVQVLGR